MKQEVIDKRTLEIILSDQKEEMSKCDSTMERLLLARI